MSKHVYANNVVDWYVAESAEQAAEMAMKLAKEQGLNREEIDLEFEQVPDDRFLSIVMDDRPPATRKTAREWADEQPVGFLATTEY